MKRLKAQRAFLSRSLLILLLLLLIADLVLSQGETNLVGSWQAKEADSTISLVLNADGTGKLDGANIKYAVSGNRLTVNDSGTINNYTLSLRESTLTV